MDFLFRLRAKRFKKNAFLVHLFLIVFVLFILIKLIDLQIFQSKTLSEKAIKMRCPSGGVVYRGEIVDRNGRRLAASTTLYDIYAHPDYYKDKKHAPSEIASILFKYINKSRQEIKENLEKPYSTITVAKNLERDVIQKIRKHKIRGLDIVKKTERVYPQKNLASHILGYVNPDANLYAGVERVALKKLESVENPQKVQYTGRGGVIYDFNTDPEAAANPLTGGKLVLTIDAAIQNIAETELEKKLKETRAEKGTVIVMKPKTGEILGFAVLPNYNPEKYNKAKASVVKNWVLSDVYPPGSTFKILTIASALENNAISKNEWIKDTGKINLQGWTIKNYDYSYVGAPGMIDLRYLFAHSSNVGSIKVALKMPPHKFYNTLKNFGFGSKTGIDLPGESAGIVPHLKKWNKVTQGSIGFGYSIAVTPIQLASAVAAIANDGVWVTPHVIKYNKEQEDEFIKRRRVLSKENANSLTNILAKSIASSRSRAGKIRNYRVAGKTGTSKKPNPKGGYMDKAVFTSFVGYFPVKDPEVLIMVVIDNPEGENIWGSTVAAPVFNSVATQVSRILNLRPDK